jgi:hypothetical protein
MWRGPLPFRKLLYGGVGGYCFLSFLASVPSQRWYMLAKTSLRSRVSGIIIEAKSELVVFTPLVLYAKFVARALVEGFGVVGRELMPLVFGR